MYAAPRKHPLQTFRFWFFVTGSVAVTLAWRFDLLPFRIGPPATGSRSPETFTELDLSEPADSAELVRAPAAATHGVDDAPRFESFARTEAPSDPFSIPAGQSEPALPAQHEFTNEPIAQSESATFANDVSPTLPPFPTEAACPSKGGLT